jgi:hypothetical protein
VQVISPLRAPETPGNLVTFGCTFDKIEAVLLAALSPQATFPVPNQIMKILSGLHQQCWLRLLVETRNQAAPALLMLL